MAMVYRNVRLYAMHGRVSGEPMNYTVFFEWLYRLPPASRIAQVSQEVSIGLEKMEFVNGVYELRFVAGNPGEDPLIFDPESGTTSVAETAPGRWVASATRAVIDPDAAIRLVALEGRRNGVSATNLERFFIRLGESLDFAPRLNFDLNPMPSASFAEEIDRYYRIREASIVVTRPNYDWNDQDDRLGELAEESGGHRAEAVVTAARGESLAKDAGIVGRIKAIASTLSLPNVSNARVTGLKNGESSESSVSLQKHQEQGKAALNTASTEPDQDASIFSRALALIVGARERAAELPDEVDVEK